MEQQSKAADSSSRSCSEETTLSSEAAFYFTSKQYEKCLVATKQLLELKPNDPKVIMNRALLDYVHKHGYTRTDDYVAELKRIASIEDVRLICPNATAGTEDSRTSGSGNDLRNDFPSTTTTTTTTGSTAPTPLPQSTLGVTLQYNYALVLFYQRQYCQSERILANCLGISRDTGMLLSEQDPSPLTAAAIELTPSTDLTICRRVLLLWLEVLLRLQHPEQVFDLCGTWLTYLSSLSIASSLHASGQTKPPTPSSGARHLNTQTSHMLNGIRLPLQLFYIRACLLTGHLAEAEEELSIVRSERMQSATQPGPLSEEAASGGGAENASDLHETISTEGIGTDSESAKVSQSPEDEAATLESSAEVCWDVGRCVEFLEAQLAYSKGNFSDAIRCLSDIPPCTRASVETGQCESTLVWNNLALVHHRAGQFNLSGLQLRRALRETDKTIRDTIPQSRANTKTTSKTSAYLTSNEQYVMEQIPLHAFSLSAHHALLYNLGLQLLFARKPSVAFTTLLHLVQLYPRNPRLWFRLAECCVKVHRPNNLQPWQLETRKRCSVEPVGVGPCRHLIVSVKQNETSNPWVETPSMATPTLEFASLCLRNAVLLLPKPPSITPSTTTMAERSNALLKWANAQRVPAFPSPTAIRGLGLLHLLSAVHLLTAYVALCLHNPVETLSSASHLLLPDYTRSSPMLLSSDGVASEPTSEETQPGQSEGTAVAKPGIGVAERDPLCLIAPLAHRFLARLYYAEALIMMDRVPESLSVLSCGSTRPLSDGACVSDVLSALQSVSLAYQHLVPLVLRSDAVGEEQQQHQRHPHAPQDSGTDSNRNWVCGASGIMHTSIYPTDYPATPSQAASLHLYNLACALAINRQWSTAEHYLCLSLPGLALPAQELDGRRWLTGTTGRSANNNDGGSQLIKSPTVLPFQARMLQLYLAVVLGKRSEALSLLHDTFGPDSLIGRLNHGTSFVSSPSSSLPPFASHAPTSPTAEINANNIAAATKETAWTLNALRQLFKSNVSLRPPNLNASNIGAGGPGNLSATQRPTSLWAPTPHGGRSVPQQPATVTHPGAYMSPVPNSQLNVNGRWDHRTASSQPHATGLITAANESDWPPL